MEEKCVKQSSYKSYLNCELLLLFSITKYISAVNRNTLQVDKSVQLLHKTWSYYVTWSYCVRTRNSTSMMGFYLIFGGWGWFVFSLVLSSCIPLGCDWCHPRKKKQRQKWHGSKAVELQARKKEMPVGQTQEV